jgi:hypothetical protein
MDGAGFLSLFRLIQNKADSVTGARQIRSLSLADEVQQ